MDKTLYWIDDDINNILDLEKHIFPVLWGLEKTDHIINKIILFGDDLKKGLDSKVLTDKREQNTIYRMVQYFKEECEKVEQANPEHRLFEEKKYLVDDIYRLFAKIPTEITPEDKKIKQGEIIELTNRIIDFWKNPEMISNDNEFKKNQADIDKLITEFGIPDNAFVAIDLVLLYKDDERVKEGNRILSMELYHRFSKVKQGRCFIYSRYISDIQLATAWEETYKKNYDQAAKVKLYKRKDFNAEEPNGTRFLDKIRDEILKG